MCQVTNETADLFIQHEEQNNGAIDGTHRAAIVDQELERMAAELEITVDYLMAEFL
jgi:hypothetical protein